MHTLNEAAPCPIEYARTFRGEADHRIANSLHIISALVRQRARSGPVQDPQTFLVEIADRIETVGQLHRLLAQSFTGTVSLQSYLREVGERLTSALGSNETSLAIECPTDLHLSPRIALQLALIAAELISNSLKYAHPAGLPARIDIRCHRREPDSVTFSYEDDGVGFPEGFNILHSGHMGVRFIETLSKGIATRHQWQSDPLGVRFEITVPEAP